MWGERGLISHKFEGTGEVGAGVCTEGLPRGCARVHDAAGWLHSGCELGVQLAVARWARLAAGGALWSCSWRLPDGPGWQLGGCTMVVQLAVARWARLAAGRVHNGRSAGGCPMGQAVSWAGAQWAFSWRLPDGPGCQLSGCSMGVQLAVARWARLSAGRVHYGRAAGGCPMGQAVNWACYGYPGALPRMPDTHDMQTRSISHTKIMMMASDIAQIIYIQIYKHSVIYAHIQGIICHMIFFEDHHGGRARGHINIRYNRGSSDICEWAWQKGAGPHFGCHAISSKTSHTSSVYTD